VHLAAAAACDEREQQRSERLLDLLAHDSTSIEFTKSPGSVHLPAELDVHLSAELDVHLSAEAHIPSKGLKVLQPHADKSWLTIACPDSTEASLASPSLRNWTNGATSRPRGCQNGQRIRRGSRRPKAHRDIVTMLM
jgi:hypothetical protein